MASYVLRDLPPHTWERFKARCLRDGWHMKALFTQLMDDYGSGLISPSRPAPSTPAQGVSPTTCANGHHVDLAFDKAALRDRMLNHPLGWNFQCPYCGVPLELSEEELMNLESWAHSASSQKQAPPPK